MQTIRSHLPTSCGFAVVLLVGLGFGMDPIGGPSRAVAQGTSDMKKAKQRFQEGRQLYQSEKYIEAARTFKEAYDLSGRGELLYNIGRAYEKAGRLQKAENFYQQYLEKEPNASNANQVVQKIITLQEKIAARMSSVEVETAQKGRDVFVGEDKKPRCQTPCSLSLQPGSHTIAVRGEGMETIEKTLEIGESESRTIELELKPDIEPGRLLVSTGGSGGLVRIDGAGEHSLPLGSPIELEPGTYQVAVRSEKGRQWQGDVDIEDSQTTRLTIPMTFLEHSGGGGGWKRGTAYGLLGASAALIGGGIVMGMQARKTHDALAREQRQFGGVNRNLLQKGRTEQQVANVLLATGVGTFLSGGGLFAWDLFAPSGGHAPQTNTGGPPPK
jgi:hypothetical protein